MSNICSAYLNSGGIIPIIIIEADCWVSIFVFFSSIELSQAPLPLMNLSNVHSGVYNTVEWLPLSLSFSPRVAEELGSDLCYLLHLQSEQESPCRVQPESLFKRLDTRHTAFEAAQWRPLQTFAWHDPSVLGGAWPSRAFTWNRPSRGGALWSLQMCLHQRFLSSVSRHNCCLTIGYYLFPIIKHQSLHMIYFKK